MKGYRKGEARLFSERQGHKLEHWKFQLLKGRKLFTVSMVMDYRGCGISVWPQAAPLMGHALSWRLYRVSLEELPNLCDSLILHIRSY